MNDALIKKESPVDCFSGYDELQDRVIVGNLIKFTNQAVWVLRDGQAVPPTLELVIVNIRRIVQRWVDHKPVDEDFIFVPPGEKFPDVEKMNEKVPRAEWTVGPEGRLSGPWQAQSVVYLLNPETMERYSYPTGTIGGSIAIGELAQSTRWMRTYRGADVYPVVRLTDTFMPTQFGGRQRPHFNIVRWVAFGADQQALQAPELPALPAPADNKAQADTASPPTQQPKVESPQSKPATATTKQPRKAAAKLQTVDPPSKDEEFDDEIPHRI